MNQVPRIPIPPAGLPSTYTSRTIRLKHYIESQRGSCFCVGEPEKPKRAVQLSHRELLVVNADKKKYAAWLSRWDRDPGVGRFLMLNDFIKQCQGFSKAQLDELYGNSSELVFIHMYAFLRLNYARGCSIALQLQALRIFFEASSGYCFAYQFLSSGGSVLLLELLKMQQNLSEEDLKEILQTFLSLTAHGPKAQQLMTETKIVEVFTQAIPEFPNSELHHMTVMLFAQIAEGDEAHAEVFCNAFRSQFSNYATKEGEALLTAAHIFHVLFSPRIAAETDIKNTISDFLSITSTDSLDVQHEAIQIFKQLLDNAIPVRRKFLFDVIIDLISVNVDEIAAEILDQRLLQQTFSLRLLQAILAKKSTTATCLYEMIQRILPALIRAIGNTQNYAAQKSACLVIAQMVTIWPATRTYLTNAMPNEWVQALLTSPNQFCLQMTPTQIDTFQGAEPSHFFFDATEEPSTKKSSSLLSSPNQKSDNQGENDDKDEDENGMMERDFGKDGQRGASLEGKKDDDAEEGDNNQKKFTSPSGYVPPQIVLRPTALKYIPSSKPKITTPRSK
ncbi:hypothetical protein TRFO_39984 [Tritrichomonas foetus]|uniref:Uncharacterized protein n=1 Tax=Tritrichomonas foetus TaxID=1144522 RepID=A0A1J4J932_9EUKA|nr:hypothetical protein TRFO_39984 [Tritrichomonas foetus]|eukprot:OHS93732.1 hypothetical protein TRFO_39984 [Tritrichomonas foetus]